MNYFKSLLLLAFVVFTSCKTTLQEELIKQPNLQEKLAVLFPGATITATKNLEGYTESFEMVLAQPLDHKDPSKGTFSHYVYLSHKDFAKPMVIETEGYEARYVKNEVSSLLDANQLIVEYRFYGKSRPNPVPWQYLTNDQAIADYHNIVTKLKNLYKGHWISTGISKGGETTLIYKSKYPNDVRVAMPYVAPLINGQEDPRTTQHINTVGDAACRAKVTQFQRDLLLNRAAVLEEIKAYASAKDMKFTEVSMEEALEYAALEFSFSFWQWGGKCDAIPGSNATPKQLFDYVNSVVGINFYSDATYHRLLPSYYQHVRELGYYGFDFTPVKDLLKVVKSTSNSRFAPKGVDLTFNPEYIKTVRNYIENKAERVLFINGGYDTWGACAPTPKPELDALKMTLPGGSHGTRVKHFSKEDQALIMKTLNRWLQ